MAKFERLEPRADDMPVFDGGIDEDDGEEGSRLPLLIVIALLVLATFAGVVYYAYTEGVERGRSDAPRAIVAQGNSGSKLKIYQQPAPSDEASSEADSVPPPPTQVAPDSKSPTDIPPAASPTRGTATKAASVPADAEASSPPPPAATAPKKSVIANSAPVQPQIATHAPAPLVPAAEAPSNVTEDSAPPPAKPAATEETPKPAAAGSYLLQVGAYKSQDDAETAWHAFQSRHPVAGGYQSDIKKVDLGDKGVWYRLRIGSFADKDAASELCSKLKADGASCLIAK
jgi:cell division septation protein DedD